MATNDEILINIGKSLKREMFLKGFTRDQLSEKSGVTRATIWKIFKGKKSNSSSIAAIISALDIKELKFEDQ